MGFWPDDINSDRVLSPTEIMREAGDELASRAATLRVEIETVTVEDRIVHSFVVINPSARRTWTLFEASHQPDACYPVLINPPVSDVPEYLKKYRFVPFKAPILNALATGPSKSGSLDFIQLGDTLGRQEENKWVCATPSEFRAKLTQLFGEDHVKVRVISMVAAGDSTAPNPRATEQGLSSCGGSDRSDSKGVDSATSSAPIAENAPP